jgi:hypothetical protein
MISNRRNALLASAALLGALLTRGYAAGAVKARLRLERKSGWAKQCTNCIPGTLYGADLPVPLRLCSTVELSFESNQVDKSAIPAQRYLATVRTDRTKSWMTDELTEWRLELLDVPGNRRAIQFHYGKDAGWSKGCIIVGENNPLACGRNECSFSDTPREGMKALRDYIMDRTVASNDLIEIEIV